MMQYEFFIGNNTVEPLRQRLRDIDAGQSVALALLTGGDGNRLPVRAFFLLALAVQAHLDTLALRRRYLCDAKLGGLLDDPVHTLAFGYSDAELNRQWRFA